MTDIKAAIERIYTDGACSGNPGPGGWGTVVYFTDGGIQELGGGDRATTNNRMELQAAIDGLGYYVESGQKQPIVLYTDSEYVKKRHHQMDFRMEEEGLENLDRKTCPESRSVGSPRRVAF